jgi:hypothetical protein
MICRTCLSRDSAWHRLREFKGGFSRTGCSGPKSSRYRLNTPVGAGAWRILITMEIST